MKRIAIIVALGLLGIAFATVSLWVMLSGERSARAVRTKFRIGGAMLTLASMISLTSCGGPGGEYGVSCYDPAPPPENDHRWSQGVANSELRNGDKVVLNYECRFGSEVKVSLVTDDGGEDRVLCSQTYEVVKGDNQLEFTIEAGDYRGRAELCVEYDKYQDGDESLWPLGGIFVAIVD